MSDNHGAAATGDERHRERAELGGDPGGPPLMVAYARHFDAASAVAQCVAQVGPRRPTLLLVFCGGKHDPHRVREALRQAFGPVEVVGGSAAGAITGSGFGYSGLELAVLAFFDPAVTPRVLLEDGLLQSETAAGRALGARVAAAAEPSALVMLFFDSVAAGAPLRLHYASSIVAGFEAGLGGKPVVLLGGGLLTDMNLSGGWVFGGQDVCRHAAVALVFPAGVKESTVVLHGCRPVSTFMEITRIEGAEVFELDGESALAVIERMLHVSLGGREGHALTLLATLGEKQGDQFAPYDENAYVNRLIITSDRNKGSVTLFEPDFRRGTMVQIMSRDNSLMLQSVKDGVAAANRAEIPGRRLLSLYIDCAGRASAFSGAAVEEAEMVMRDLDLSVPLVGFYSGVEIAPFDGYSRPLDWTGMLTTLSWGD
jgi:hypothetical protein